MSGYKFVQVGIIKEGSVTLSEVALDFVGGEDVAIYAKSHAEKDSINNGSGKHWKDHLYGGSIESHTEFLLSGHKRALNQHPSKKALMNHIERLYSLLMDCKLPTEEPPRP